MNRQTEERVSAVRTTANMQGPGHTQWVPAPYTPTDKLPLIIFGNAMFGTKKNSVHFSGHRHGLVDVLWRTIKKRERQGHIIAIEINEYLTSQVRAHICLQAQLISIYIDTIYIDL